jgi:hypothetical protein
MLGYNRLSRYSSAITNKLSNKRRTLTLFNKTSLNIADSIDIDYSRPYNIGKIGILNYLTKSKNGIYITSFRSDTIYYLDNKLNLKRKFVDVTKDDENYYQLFPAMETDKYLFFSTENIVDTPNLKFEYLVLDKSDNKIYEIKSGDGKNLNYRLLLLNNQIAFNQMTLTLNHNYAIVTFTSDFIYKHIKQFPEKYKTDALFDADSNYLVVMLIKIRERQE